MRAKGFLLIFLLLQTWSVSALHFTPKEVLAPQNIKTQFALPEYIEAYLNNSPDVQAHRNTLRIARNTYRNAFSTAFLPSFSLTAQTNKSYSRDNRPAGWKDTGEWDSSFYGEGNWNVFNSGKDLLSYRAAAFTYEQARVEFDAFIQEQVLGAVRNYYNLIRSRKLLEVYRDDLASAEKQYEHDKVLYENGLKKRSDLLSSETNFRSGQLSFFAAQNDYNNTLKDFNIAIAQPLETEVTLDETIDESSAALPPLDTDLTQAVSRRHDARLRRLQLARNEVNFRLGKINLLPAATVDLFASTGRPLHYGTLWGYNYGISAGLTWDLGFFYTDKYRRRENLTLEHENDNLEYEQFLRTLRDDVVQMRNNLQLKMQSLHVSRLRLEAAQQNFEATQTKYKNGMMSATDLSFARKEMISAQVDYATLLSDLTLARLRYRYALGEDIYPVTEDFLND